MNASTRIRRLLIWAMVAQYGLVVSGLPLPMATPSVGPAAAAKLSRKDRSTPFPCMDKACGCDSAERCFSGCCCHTSAETLAWAKAQGIEPELIDALARRALASRSCGLRKDDVDNAICSDYQSLAAEPRGRRDHAAMPDEPPPAPAEGDQRGGVVILRAALACGGVTAQWNAVSASLVPPGVVTCDLQWPQVGRVTLVDATLCGAKGPPDLPPPRA